MGRKIPDTITEEEFVKIIKNVKKDHHRLAFLEGFYQAMRVGEIVKLKPEHIIPSQHIVQIKQAKGNKDRHIPIIQPLLLGKEEVLRALNKFKEGKIKPFNNETEKDVKNSIRALEIAIKYYGKKILGKDIHFHTLRHSGATWLLNKKKWDIRKIQTFLGHSKIETTTIYAHVSSQDLVELEWGETAK